MISSVCAAFHQQFALRLADQFDRLGGGGFAVGDVDDLVLADVETMLLRHCADLFCRTDKDRHDDAGFRGFERAAKRAFIARVGHNGDRSGHLLCSSNEPLVFRRWRVADRADRGDASDLGVFFVEHDHFSPRAGMGCGAAVLL